MHQDLEGPNETPWRRQWQPTPVLLPGKSHGWRRLVGCSPWGREESDTTKRLHFHFFTFMHWRRKWQPTPVFLPGNPRDGGALWAAVYGVTPSQTQLKRLSNETPWRRKWQPTPVFLPGESQGQRSLVGCHLWDRTELDMTEAT